jgi:hypothetical protein
LYQSLKIPNYFYCSFGINNQIYSVYNYFFYSILTNFNSKQQINVSIKEVESLLNGTFLVNPYQSNIRSFFELILKMI